VLPFVCARGRIIGPVPPTQVNIALKDAGAFFPWHAKCLFANQSNTHHSPLELVKISVRPMG